MLLVLVCAPLDVRFWLFQADTDLAVLALIRLFLMVACNLLVGTISRSGTLHIDGHCMVHDVISDLSIVVVIYLLITLQLVVDDQVIKLILSLIAHAIRVPVIQLNTIHDLLITSNRASMLAI